MLKKFGILKELYDLENRIRSKIDSYIEDFEELLCSEFKIL